MLSIGRRVRFKHALRALATLPPAQTVLDAGCGDGRLVRAVAMHFPAAEVHGIDSDCDAVRRAERDARIAGSDRVRWSCVAIGDEHFDQVFDVILSTDVLEHIRNDGLALRWLTARLAPGGTLILHVPASPQKHVLPSVARAAEREVASGEGPHFREGYSPGALMRLAEAVGLEPAALGATFHIRPTRWATDVETAIYLSGHRWMKAILLPLLLLCGAVERHTGEAGSGNGLLLVGRKRR